MAIPSNPHEASPKIGVLLTGGRKSLGGRGLSVRPVTFSSVGRAIGLDVRVADGHLYVRSLLPRPMWSWRLSSGSSFCRVILFPDTDPEGRAFRVWYDAAQQVMRSFFWPRDNPIRVSPILELHATQEQKLRKIDLVDFLFEASKPSGFSVNSPLLQPQFKSDSV